MVTLCILDGFGINKNELGNAIKAAGTPYLDKLAKEYPYAEIEASGEAVGLPEGQMGNSEVGHLTIGAGRIIEQDLLHIDNEIKRGDFAKNEALVKAFKYAEENGTNLHLIGLASDGGIHSKLAHMYAILDASKEYNINNIYILNRLHQFRDITSWNIIKIKIWHTCHCNNFTTIRIHHNRTSPFRNLFFH